MKVFVVVVVVIVVWLVISQGNASARKKRHTTASATGEQSLPQRHVEAAMGPLPRKGTLSTASRTGLAEVRKGYWRDRMAE